MVIGPMGTTIRMSNVERYLEGLGANAFTLSRSDIFRALESGAVDGVVTVDERLVQELRPLYSGPLLELQSRSDFNESADVVVVASR